MSAFKDKIIDIAMRTLGTGLRPNERGWEELKPLIRNFTADAVIDAFKDWAETRTGDIVSYPLSEFARIAPGILQGVIIIKTDPAAKQLIEDLTFIANDARVTFNRSQSIVIAKLLVEHSADDIKAALREFLSPISEDDYRLKRAAQAFTEAAEQLLALQGRRKLELARRADTLEAARRQSQLELQNEAALDDSHLIEETL